MPNINSFADITHDWEQLLRAFADSAEVLAPAEPQRAGLEQILNRVRETKARQDSHTANRQQATQELEDLVKNGLEQARRLRGMVKGLLGTKAERLVQFSVAPIRPRSRKTQKQDPLPEAGGGSAPAK
jgi:phosphoenolpyruvate carboxylase